MHTGCDEVRADIVVSAKKGIHIMQKEVSETEISAKAYGQGLKLFGLDLSHH